MLKRRFLLAAVLVALPLAGCGVFKGGGGPKTPTVGDRVSILSNDASIKVDPALAETAVVLPAPVANADWAQSGGKAAKSMGHLALAASRSQIWSARIPGSITTQRLGAAPAVADHRMVGLDPDAVVSASTAANAGH